MHSQGITSTPDYNALLTVLVECRRYKTVISLVEQLESQSDETYAYPNIDTWKILITCHSYVGQMYLAFSLLFDKIINAGHLPSTSTLNDLFQGLSRKDEMQKAMLFYKYVILKGFQLDHISYRILISGFCDIGDTERAIQLLREAEQVPRHVDQG
ncbi:pentatricopeptide repeat-containing protein, partial [Trifolium medium]|nr:pentatricopeptide repeat-containing protein [Trifolium medium]